jgi:hypothetical protein
MFGSTATNRDHLLLKEWVAYFIEIWNKEKRIGFFYI